MAAITALNVSLGMDASNFVEGTELARSEVNRVNSIMRQSVPPAQKFQNELGLLNKTFSATGKQTKEYANAVEFLRRKHGQLDPAIAKANGAVDQLRESMLSAVPGGSMLAGALRGPAGAALALAAAAAVVARGVSEAATRIDETVKSARTLGMAYNDLVAIQMLAGETAGLSGDDVNRSLGQMTKRLAEARVNGGSLSETLKGLGLDAGQLAAMDPAKAFQSMADVIKGIPDEAEQIRVATQLLGKEGIKMVEVFRQGGGALEKMREESERLGLTLSDADTASIETMNDAFGRSGMAVQGIYNSLATALAPTLTNVARLTEEFFVLVRKVGENITMFSPALGLVLPTINKMVEGFRFIVALVNDAISLFASLPSIVTGGEINAEFSETNRFLDEMDKKAQGIAPSMKTASEQSEALAIEIERAAEATRKIEESYEKRIKDLQIESIALAGNTEEAERMRLIAEGYSKVQADSILALQKQNAMIKERMDLEKKASEEAKKEAEKAEKEAQKRLDDAKKKMEEVEKAFTVEVGDAMKAANAYFSEQRKRDEEMRKQVAKGPSSMEQGSGEAARYMADRANAAIGAAAVPEKPTPGEKEIAEKARELLVAQREANAKQETQLATMKELLTEFRQNGFRRVR
jgi:hypothetical protein